MTDGPLDERCTDCGALVDACRCPDDDVWDQERYFNGDDTCPRCGSADHSWCQLIRPDEF